MIPCSSIRDRAITLETYARQAHNVEAERKACEIRLRAERKAGALSAKLERRRGKRTDKQPPALTDRDSTKAERLHAAGVSPRQAKNWQKLAAVPDKEFEAAVADRTMKSGTDGTIKMNTTPNRGVTLGPPVGILAQAISTLSGFNAARQKDCLQSRPNCQLVPKANMNCLQNYSSSLELTYSEGQHLLRNS